MQTPIPPRSAVLAALALLAPCAAVAQASCSSDGQPRPVALLERFINADCEACWADAAAPRPARGAVAIDWIVPASKGEDAPLSAAAQREAVDRLASLGRAVPAQADAVAQPLARPALPLRVAHGLPFNGYLGTQIALRRGGQATWTAWLALVETVPAGTDGAGVERNLVRNVLQPAWDKPGALSKAEQLLRRESRSMSIPENAKPERLRLVGWVQDARGRIRSIAQSRCTPEGTKP